MEKIEDILSEMRTLGFLDKDSDEVIPRKHMASGFLSYASRIWAAVQSLIATSKEESEKNIGETKYQKQCLIRRTWIDIGTPRSSKDMQIQSAQLDDSMYGGKVRVIKVIETKEVVWESK